MCIAHEGTWSMFVVMCEHVGETCDIWWQLPNPLMVCKGMWMLIRSVHPIHLLVKTDLTYPNLKPLVGFRGWVIRLGWNFILSFWLS